MVFVFDPGTLLRYLESRVLRLCVNLDIQMYKDVGFLFFFVTCIYPTLCFVWMSIFALSQTLAKFVLSRARYDPLARCKSGRASPITLVLKRGAIEANFCYLGSTNVAAIYLRSY